MNSPGYHLAGYLCIVLPAQPVRELLSKHAHRRNGHDLTRVRDSESWFGIYIIGTLLMN